MFLGRPSSRNDERSGLRTMRKRRHRQRSRHCPVVKVTVTSLLTKRSWVRIPPPVPCRGSSVVERWPKGFAMRDPRVFRSAGSPDSLFWLLARSTANRSPLRLNVLLSYRPEAPLPSGRPAGAGFALPELEARSGLLLRRIFFDEPGNHFIGKCSGGQGTTRAPVTKTVWRIETHWAIFRAGVFLGRIFFSCETGA